MKQFFPMITLAVVVAAVPTNLSAQTPEVKPARSYQPPSSGDRFRQYLLDAYGPTAIVGAGVTAAFDQSDKAQPEWKQGTAGFGRRVGSSFGQFAIAETTRHGLAAILRQDTKYYRCECRGIFPRLGHALVSSITARTTDGRRVVSIPDLVAPYAGGLTATAMWYPDRFGPKDGIRLGTFAFGIHAGMNVVREFLPSRKH